MAIITISRGSYLLGTAVAEKVAQRLNYELISREVLLDASERFNVPEIKLVKAIHDAPGMLERYSHSKLSYIAYIKAALTERVAKDNVIYHGLAGHLLLKGIPHVLKVRITTDLEIRIKNVMKMHGGTEEGARTQILEDDRQRRKWTKSLYGEDPWDCALYDLVLRVDKLTIENAVDYICMAATTDGYIATKKDIQKASDIALACRIKAALADDYPDLRVTCNYGNILVYIKGKSAGTTKLKKKLRDISSGMQDIYNIEVHAGIPIPPDAV